MRSRLPITRKIQCGSDFLRCLKHLHVLLEDMEIDALFREKKVVLPAISTEGARSVMKRLCEEADLDVGGEYLKPHGARCGLGDELFRTNPTDAQAALRHSSIAITNKSHSHIEAGEISDVIDSMQGEEKR
jgi:integrase